MSVTVYKDDGVPARRAHPVSMLEAFRRQAGYTVIGFARRLGFTHSYVSRVESRDCRASWRFIEGVAEVLGVDPDLVFDEGGWVMEIWSDGDEY